MNDTTAEQIHSYRYCVQCTE